MTIKTYTCTKQSYNPNMGGMQCFSGETLIFHIDKSDSIKVGDTVQIEVDTDGLYKRIWVNGELTKTP